MKKSKEEISLIRKKKLAKKLKEQNAIQKLNQANYHKNLRFKKAQEFAHQFSINGEGPKPSKRVKDSFYSKNKTEELQNETKGD